VKGLPPFIVPVVCLGMMVLIQIGLMFQPSNVVAVIALWAAAAVFGSAGPVAYVAIGPLFPPEQTGRVATAVNMLSLGGAFLVQAVAGWILDLWPRTASGGWDPAGYSWALALTAVLQTISAVVLATAPRRA
jgi:MFS family permease